MKTSTSIHNLNADKGLGIGGKICWLLFNFIVNSISSKRPKDLCIRQFRPEVGEKDWEKIHIKASPPRALSDLFWLNLDWQAIRAELRDINIFDTGAGNGEYASKLQNYSGGMSNYFGVDYYPHKEWNDLMSANKFVTMKQHISNNILDVIPKNTNFFISQSAIEHFEDDLLFFRQIRQFIEINKKNTIQVHLFPSAICLKLYPWHGIRQYTPGTISEITQVFRSPNTYAILFGLGGNSCNELHYQFVTRPKYYPKLARAFGSLYPTLSRRILGKVNQHSVSFNPLLDGGAKVRNHNAMSYRSRLKIAVNEDLKKKNIIGPSFYGLVIHSNFNKPIFKTMKKLSGG